MENVVPWGAAGASVACDVVSTVVEGRPTGGVVAVTAETSVVVVSVVLGGGAVGVSPALQLQPAASADSVSVSLHSSPVTGLF